MGSCTDLVLTLFAVVSRLCQKVTHHIYMIKLHYRSELRCGRAQQKGKLDYNRSKELNVSRGGVGPT